MGMLLASLLALLAVESLIRLPFDTHAGALRAIANKSAHVVFSKKISDHWKEVVLLCYAKKVAIHTIVVALILIGSVLLVVLSAYLLDFIFAPNPSVTENISNLSGLSSMSIVSFLYLVLRKHIANI